MRLTTLPRERATTRFLSVADDIRGLRVEAKQHDAIKRGAICVHSIRPALGRREPPASPFCCETWSSPTRRAAKKRRNLGSNGVVVAKQKPPLLLQAPPQRGAVTHEALSHRLVTMSSADMDELRQHRVSDTLRQRHASAGRAPGAPAEPPASPGTGGAPPKSLLFAYFLWVLPLLVPPVGLLGLHHVYLGRDVHAALYMISFGGFGLGWLRDGVRLSDYVRQASPSAEEHGLERRRRELYPRPGGLVRLLAAGYFASNFSLVLRSVWPAPEESPLPQADAWAEVALGALGIALGVWAVGSVTPQACEP